MGQNASNCCEDAAFTEDIFEVKRAIYAYYPGLEQQLEMAYACHDVSNQGVLPYSTLEPVIRHLLMQYGLIEYVTRFSNEKGALDSKHISRELRAFGVNIRGWNYEVGQTCEDFKSLAVCWLKKILDTYADDQAEWVEKLRAQQEEQSMNYMQAMKNFQEQYVTQQALYQQGIEEQQQQIAEWNKLLEDTQRTQQEVYEAEVRRMEEIKEKEDNAAVIAAKEQRKILEEYSNQIKKMASEDQHGICFAYPSSATPYGACVSAGAQEPVKRKRKKREIQKHGFKGTGDEQTPKSIRGCC